MAFLEDYRDEWIDGRRRQPAPAADVSRYAVEISPPDIAERRVMTAHGLAAEFVQTTSLDRIEHRFHAPVHLLVVYERGARIAGETYVEGMPPSTLRDFSRKLTFVPAGHRYHEWQEPRTLTRLTYFYLDPANPQFHPASGVVDMRFAQRLFFEDPTLRETALKLKSVLESSGPLDRLYFEALGAVLMHELVRLNRGAPHVEPQIRGGLAAWQQRAVAAHIEAHLAEQIPVGTLAQIARLSLCHFCRAFKQSFGISPHRYHSRLRIERAKWLLAKSDSSVTEIGFKLGFSETSSFTTAFRKATGITPTSYQRSLD
ncbi:MULTISPECIES: AraC family transcriptional regulator [Rhodomicrobium]|uniref:AraC family transcriptional regulator n=1 Tax=Rhodomicrobium TaxID=1068 RepID=UPI000B4C0F04|nr:MULTISPECIES: AraC family transcriptional regulator [Rhodomicrobium]